MAISIIIQRPLWHVFTCVPHKQQARLDQTKFAKPNTYVSARSLTTIIIKMGEPHKAEMTALETCYLCDKHVLYISSAFLETQPQ